MLGHRLRRWPNFETPWGEYLVFAMDSCRVTGRGPRVVVSTPAFHARVRGSIPDHGGLKETNMFFPHPLVKTQYQYCGEPQ